MADIEKAREQLQDAIRVMRANGMYYDDVHICIDAALRALDGDGAEEKEQHWFAWPETTVKTGGTFLVGFSTKATRPSFTGFGDGAGLGIIATGLSEATARRIARLPALERAAGRVIEVVDGCRAVPVEVVEALRAALKQEGQ